MAKTPQNATEYLKILLGKSLFSDQSMIKSFVYRFCGENYTSR